MLVTAPAASAAAVTTTTAIFARSHRPCFSYSHVAPAILGPIELLDGIGRFLIRRHLNKAKPFTSACVTIRNDLGRLNASCLSENFLQSFIRCAERKVANV